MIYSHPNSIRELALCSVTQQKDPAGHKIEIQYNPLFFVFLNLRSLKKSRALTEVPRETESGYRANILDKST